MGGRGIQLCKKFKRKVAVQIALLFTAFAFNQWKRLLLKNYILSYSNTASTLKIINFWHVKRLREDKFFLLTIGVVKIMKHL
jgi:hypothetical protein